MPFTAAHPFAVVPLVRWQRLLALDATCLVIGSMAPDFEYFVRGEQVSTISHTLRGALVFDLPVTLVLAALWHVCVKRTVLLVAPRRFASRVASSWRAPWPAGPRVRAAASLVISALIGTATHLVWDGITHAKGYGPQHFRWLKQPVDVPVLGSMVLHRVLQHASTVVGLLGLAIAIAYALRRMRPVALPDVPRLGARLAFLACVLAGAALLEARIVFILHATDIGDLIVGPVAGALAGVVVASLLLRRRAAIVRA